MFLLSDDQTIGAVGCYGNKDVITPNLDKLAGEGVRFLNHYDTTSICMASRANIMTGLYGSIGTAATSTTATGSAAV
ncbi:MAG: sulfatase-like hydrolase/transferase [Planctomycetaceae bacterium]